MKASDFYLTTEELDSFGVPQSVLKDLDVDLVNKIAKAPHKEWSDRDVLKTLLQLAQDDLIAMATSGPQTMNDDTLRVCLRAIRSLLSRTGIGSLDLPFRDFSGWYDYWRKEEMSGGGSWSVRRGFIQSHFQPLIQQIEELEDREFVANLSDPASDFKNLENWADINSEIAQLRQRFNSSVTAQDFSAVGNSCVRIIEGISRVSYVQATHGQATDTGEPPVNKTDIRIGRVIELGLGGRKNTELKSLAKASSAVAHRVKHGRTPTHLQAGISCDATILLASIVQRIEDDRLSTSI